jgi:hypothetical protein
MFVSLIIQATTLVNFFFNICILFILFIFGYLEIVSESFVIISALAIFTQGFSANIRNIYLGSNILNLKIIILIRILISVVAFILINLLTYIFIGKFHILFHSSIIFLTVTSWILELFIARYEKNRFINIYFIANIFLTLLCSIILIFFKNIFFLSLLIYCSSLINFYIFKTSIKNVINQNKIRIKIKKNLELLGVSSTLLKVVANFFWRLFAIILVGKTYASLLFVGFMFGSFFGTLFDVGYGAYFLKKIKKKIKLITTFFLIYFALTMFCIYFIKNFFALESEKFNIFLNTALFSIFGSYFLVLALLQRQLFFEIQFFKKICYKVDICIYSFNLIIIPILYYFNQKYLIISFFISSLFSYFLYVILVKNAYSKKIF